MVASAAQQRKNCKNGQCKVQTKKKAVATAKPKKQVSKTTKKDVVKKAVAKPKKQAAKKAAVKPKGFYRSVVKNEGDNWIEYEYDADFCKVHKKSELTVCAFSGCCNEVCPACTQNFCDKHAQYRGHDSEWDNPSFGSKKTNKKTAAKKNKTVGKKQTVKDDPNDIEPLFSDVDDEDDQDESDDESGSESEDDSGSESEDESESDQEDDSDLLNDSRLMNIINTIVKQAVKKQMQEPKNKASLAKTTKQK